MTEKLYYSNAYIKEFSATVLSSERIDGEFCVVLDKTAFFPEEGGQYSDTGTLGGARVFKVTEKNGVIRHYTDKPLSVGASVEGKIDFDERYEKMQCHTGEHILSGIIHSLYGLDNVGFHLGAQEVTMDISAPLTREELDRVELLANEVIYQNVEVTAEFPSPSELLNMEYRSKLDLTENVRIVRIGEYDACACCAPHVKYTGEIGLIKILDFAKLRGGIRIRIAAGRRAMRIFREYYSSAQAVSNLLSLPKEEISEGVKKLCEDISALRAEYSAYRLAAVIKRAEELSPTEKNAVIKLEGAGFDELIAFSNAAISKVGGILVVLSGTDGALRYVISSKTVNIKEIIPEINKSLLGRGGGRANMAQGTFASEEESVRRYFSR